MKQKDLVVILSESDYNRDDFNMTIKYMKSDSYFYSGYNKISDISTIDENEYIKASPPFFCDVKVMSVVLPIKEFKVKEENKNISICFYNKKFILVPDDHLHIVNNKYKYIYY